MGDHWTIQLEAFSPPRFFWRSGSLGKAPGTSREIVSERRSTGGGDVTGTSGSIFWDTASESMRLVRDWESASGSVIDRKDFLGSCRLDWLSAVLKLFGAVLLLDKECGLSFKLTLRLSFDVFRRGAFSSAAGGGTGDGECDGGATDRDERERPKADMILNAPGGLFGADCPGVGVDTVRSVLGRGEGVTNETSEGAVVDGCVGGESLFAASKGFEYTLMGFPFSAYCAYSKSCDRRSHVGGASLAHFE